MSDVDIGSDFGAASDSANAGANAAGGTPGVAGSSNTTGGTSVAGAGISGVAGEGAAGLNTGGTAACVIQRCGNVVTECGDCIDNDGDGSIDLSDPECFGACDDRERSFVVGSSAPASCKVDCFFDKDSGGGNDGCSWSHDCDPLSVAPNYPPSGEAKCAVPAEGPSAECLALRTNQPATCLENCGPITPNGCDCFGCCELPSSPGKHIWLGSVSGEGEAACSTETLADPLLCRPCTPVVACLNTCKPCEVCFGRPDPDPSCTSPVQECPVGQEPCGRPGQAECATGLQCTTGCCVPAK